jgi:hypothetical protein
MNPLTMRSGVVSTVIAVYNRAQLLAEAVDSVLAQSYRPIEIVIVDDGSTDGSGEVAKRFATRHPEIVRYTYQANAGHASATNHGLRLITGEFVQLLDSDDLLMADKFTRQVAALRAHPECGIAYGYAREYALGGQWSGLPARRTGQVFTHLFPALLSGKIWPAPTPLYRRTVIDEIGPFLEVTVHQDWEYECRAAARGVRLHHCPAYVADLRGAHHLEGRKKGGASGKQLQEWAVVLERILASARSAGVRHADLDALSKSLFNVARKCAAAGHEAEARRCLALGCETGAAARRFRMALFRESCERFGWIRTGRLVERIDHSGATDALRALRTRPRVFAAAWRHRLSEAVATTTGQPPGRWPGLLWHRWQHRRSKMRAHV